MSLHSKRLLGIVLLFLLAVAAGNVHAGFFYGKQNFYTIKTEHFYVHFQEGLGPIAEDMRAIVEEQYTNISTELEWKPKGRTHVVLSDKTDQANGLATVMPYNYILLYVTHPTADSTLDVYKDYLRLLFAHEFTHIVHIDMHYRWATPFRTVMGKVVAPNGATPGWMREGMAVFEESKLADGFGRNNVAYTDMVLRTSILENKFPKIGQVNGSTPHFPSGLGPYLYGGKFMQWLAKKYGEDRIYKYQKLYASGLWAFSFNNKARRVFGKSFYKLWKEFETDLAQEYATVKQEVSARGLTSFQDVVKNKNSQKSYTVSADGRSNAYYDAGFDESPFIQIQSPGKEPVQIKRKLQGQMSFSSDGKFLAFSSLATVEPKGSHSEVYYYDTEKKSLFRVYDRQNPKKSMRASDPDFSSVDGGQRWLVMVRKKLNTDQLYIYDILEKRGYFITNEPKYTQLANPRFSPDGKSIVVSRKDAVTGYRDILMYSSTGQKLAEITHDQANDNHPIFSRDGGSVYFDSYRTGIANIFKYNINQKTLAQVTNVVDGVFQPMPAASGSELYVKRYTSDVEFIQKFDASSVNSNLSLVTVSQNSTATELPNTDAEVLVAGRNYSLLQSSPGAKPVVVSHPQKLDEMPQTSPAFLGATASEDDDISEAQVPDDFKHEHSSMQGGQSLEDTVTYNRSVARFAANPDDISQLPEAVFSSSKQDKSTDSAPDETKSVTPTQQQQVKSYPSSYKDSLSQFPEDYSVDASNPADAKKYSAFPQLLIPKYIMPNMMIFENAALIGVQTGKSDPLYRHSWSAFANYRTDAKFAGGGATYIYSRYDPIFYVGGLRYSVDWGLVNGTRFFEERDQGYAGVSFALGQHKFNTTYFYEHRSPFTNLSVNLVNMKPYAGVKFQYSTARFKKFQDSISQEDGYSINIGGTVTDSALGASGVNEERLLHADLRYYIEMPWSDHHVLAFRVAGGWVWGDVQQFGVYRLGGPFGEGPGFNASARLYPMRGLPGITFGGDRVFMFSGEYRLPLYENVNFGVGTWPVFLDKIHANFFVDGGDIKFRTEVPDLFTRMMVSVGGEIKGDFVFGYGLPMTLRLGYGIILTNRDRLGTLTDSITQQSVRYGSAYFQLGTMF